MESPSKFRRDSQIKWYRCPIDREVLSGLMQSSDLHAFCQVFCQLGLFFTTATLAYLAYRNVNSSNWVWSVPLLLAALFVHGTQGPFMGLVAVHELCHKTPFRTKFMNEVFLRIYSFISWSDYIWFRPSHVKHHQLTVHRDYDGEVVLPSDLNFKNWRFWLGILAWNPQGFWNTLKAYARRARGHIDGDWYQHILPESKPELRRRHCNWARTVLIGHAILAALFVVTGHWFLIVVFTMGTSYCGWLGFLCGTPQHYGLSSNVPDFRLCCRTYTCSFLPAFFYWNMQYHVEHHMYPAVPFYNLPKLRRAIEHNLPPAPHGLWATWKVMLEIHRRRLQDCTYAFVPELTPSEGTRAEDTVLEREASLT
ncbi:MAG: fatty acid desaturase [Planctomycetes bacterium]|nr:fatty acid desaturase [Planctomycetota bacterium]